MISLRLRVLLATGLLLGCGVSPPHPSPPAGASATGASASEGPPDGGACRGAALAVQVLGSGGPIPDDDRASAGYLVWQGGKARVLVDAGGGTFVRFGEAGARVADLDAVAVTHLHADHVADLPALLKGGYFAERSRKLPLIGPSGNERFPAMDEFVSALFDPQRGAFRYLSGYVTGEGLFPLDVRVADAGGRTPVTIFEDEGLRIAAVGVRHGDIPSLGFLVTAGGQRIAFSGDQSADSAAFEAMIRGADLLVVHHAIPESAAGVRHLHRTPSEIGALALAAKVERVVLSHNMRRALDELESGLAAVSAVYGGPVEVAGDLSCYVL